MTRLISTCEDVKDMKDLHDSGADGICAVMKDCAFSTLRGWSIEELKEAVQTAHELGMELRVLMNRLFLQKEIGNAQCMMDEVIGCGADAVVFADPGLLMHAMEKGYADKLIYRSETMTTSAEDVRWFEDCGLKGVMLSPLLTKEEIMSIASKCEHCGLLIHGYLLESVSRRTLVQAFGTYTGRTDLMNRKDLTLREEKREGRMPVYENAYCTMIHTDYVQESFEFVRMFADHGAETFEINGEYLPFETVKDAVQAYSLILKGADGQVIREAYKEKWNRLPLEEGYYGQKTVR